MNTSTIPIQQGDLLPGIPECDGFWAKMGHRPNWAIIFDPQGKPIERIEGPDCHERAIAYVRGATAGYQYAKKEVTKTHETTGAAARTPEMAQQDIA